MDIEVRDAQLCLDDLLKRAAAGETIVLLRDGKVSGRIVSETSAHPRRPIRTDVIEDIARRASAKALPGPDAAHAADFLYDEFGLPV